MAGKFESLTLGDVVTLQRGTTYKSALLGQPGPVLLGLASIKRNGGFRDDNLKTYGGESPAKLLLRPGDVFVSLKDVTQSADLLGAVARVPLKISSGRVTQDTVKLTFTRKDIPASYVYWLLRTPGYREYCRAHAIGTTNLSIARDDFLAYPVARPSAQDMTLVRTLDALDDKIELNRKMNEKLEQMAQALFKSWFVEFDPAHAKASGRQPVRMDKATAEYFPNSLVDSDLGKIPKGWKVNLLEDLVEQRTERIDATSAKDNLRYIALEDMPSRSLDLSSYQPGSAVNSSIIKFKEGDILFGSMRPYFHKVGLAFFEGITRTTTFVLKPKKQHLRHFALLHIFSDDLISCATTSSVGTTMPYVKWESLARYRVITPPDELLSIFDNKIREFIVRIGANGAESIKLAAVRDTLLARLAGRSTPPNTNG